MPELPEVEVISRGISEFLFNKMVKKVKFFREGLRFPFPVSDIQSVLAGQKVISVTRKFKFLCITTKNGSVRINLGMSGSFFILSPGIDGPEGNHHHVSILLKEGGGLGYRDPRRFGYWMIYDPAQDESVVDPLDSAMLEMLFQSIKFTTSKRRVWDFLLDQRLIGGIGNIYALESLFLANINPVSRCDSIVKKKRTKLAYIIPEVLNKAIQSGGSTIRSYSLLSGESGSFQDAHLVYGQAGKSCSRCKTIIRKQKSGSRTVYFCPKCQLVRAPVPVLRFI